METLHTQILREILIQYGRSVLEEPRRVKALLGDHLGKQPGNHEQAINVLTLALENRVVQDLLVSDGLPPDMVQRRVADRLKSSLGLAEGMANWVVGVWAATLTPQSAVSAVPVLTPVSSGGSVHAPLPAARPPIAQVETEGPRASSRFDSITQAGAGPPSASSGRSGRPKLLWLALVGGGAVLLVGLLWIVLGSSSTPTAAKSDKAVPDTWKVIFRSDNPSLWNDDINDKKHFAMTLSQVPDSIRYLRMTDLTTKDFVILEMSKDRLGRRSELDRYGWDGSNDPSWGGRHLGIYNMIWPAAGRGEVAVSSQPYFRGWGFGHHQHINDSQRYSWEGKPIDKTIFEIAVKSEPLTEAETKKLLKVGNPRQ